MFSDKLKNLFKKTLDSNEQGTFTEKVANLISSNRRPLAESPSAQFQQYLQGMPWQDLKSIRHHKPKPKKTATLRPQLVTRCRKNVPALFFDRSYVLNHELFVRNRREVSQQTGKMHEYLDQVEVCLFNQISSRFDQILAVLRTIESLECVVDYNSERLARVRGNNIQLAKKASQRHLRIISLLRRQESLKKTLDKLAEVKLYTSFMREGTDETLSSGEHSQKYEQIGEIRLRRELFFQLKATRNFEERVEELEANLKKSYSDNINDAFFKYAVEIVPYDSRFWERKFVGRVIFEEEEEDMEGTVILDESVLMEEEGGVLKIRLEEEREKQIVSNLMGGWREGNYTTGSLKAALDKFIREKQHLFLSDCRNFCFESYIREQRQKIENPSLANLMQQMNVAFCSKTFLYHGDSYRTLLTRCFSLVNRLVGALLGVAEEEELSIEEKQRLTLIVDGLFSILSFCFKAVYEKVLELVELKRVYDSMEVQDFKQLINVLETEEDFIDKNLRKYLIGIERTPKGSKITKNNQQGSKFLSEIVANYAERCELSIVTRSKEEKVRTFLNKTHRYIIQNQLRDSFENEIWKPTDIPTFYYDSLHYLITGESLNLRRNKNHTIRHNLTQNQFDSSVFIDRLGKQASVVVDQQLISRFRIIRNEIIIEQKVYKVTGTLLLLLEFIEDYMHLVQFYPFLQQQAGHKIFELLRAYHTTSHQLIFLAGAVKLGKIKSKTITARHLALNSLCLSFLLYLTHCIRDRVPIHDQQKIRADLTSHEDNIIKRLASIINGKYTQALNDINLGNVPSKGTEAIVTDTKKLHDILIDFYQKDVLSRIFVGANLELYLGRLKSLQVASRVEAESLKDELAFFFHELQFLEGLISNFRELRLQGEDIVRVKFQDL